MSIKDAPIEKISEYLSYLKDKAQELSKDCPITENHEAWRVLYDIVFEDGLYKEIKERFKDFRPDIPDSTYHDDVCAVIDGFKVFAQNSIAKRYFMSFEEFVNKK